MSTKYFCDVCGIEVDDPSYSLDRVGKGVERDIEPLNKLH